LLPKPSDTRPDGWHDLPDSLLFSLPFPTMTTCLASPRLRRCRSGLLAIVFAVCGLAAPGIEAGDPEKSILRVNATLQSYNFLRPWEKGAPTPRRGLGAVIEGNRVLVTAESIVDATYVELEHPSTGATVPARIVTRDYESNLALLEPANTNSRVFEDIVPFDIDTGAVPGDALEVWQVEDNGDGVSTEVELLRVSVGSYFTPGSVFLLYQVRGSLQSRTNSFTLPVVKDGKLCGMLLSYSSQEQTATILPAPIIRAFLDDHEEGDYKGFPNLGINIAQTLDEVFREYLGIADKEGGIFVRSVTRGSSADLAGIKEGDVILAFDGQPIDARGNYIDPDYGRISFSHVVRGAAKVGDRLTFDIIRDKELLSVEVELQRMLPEDYLVDPYLYDRGPKFLIFGGLIFQELTLPFLESWGDEWPTRAPFKLVYANANPDDWEDEGREKIVFLTNVLKTPSTLGYENFNSAIVTEVNGNPIRHIRELADALGDAPESGIHTIEFTDYPKVIYVDDRASRQINQQLIQVGIAQMERLD